MSFTVGQLKDMQNKHRKGLAYTHRADSQRINIPGIKGHLSGEGVRRALAKQEANAAVEAVSVCNGRQWALLQQG